MCSTRNRAFVYVCVRSFVNFCFVASNSVRSQPSSKIDELRHKKEFKMMFHKGGSCICNFIIGVSRNQRDGHTESA